MKSAEAADAGGARPEVKIVAAEPENAALLAGKPFAPHKVQGWTPDFVPGVLNRAVPDQLITISDAESIATARALASQVGILCCISSGAGVGAALKLAQQVPEGSVLLAVITDTGERYLSTALFEGIADGSDDEP